MSSITVWRIVTRDNRGFVTVYKVKRHVNCGAETAFFKYTKPFKEQKYIGPLIANELISNRLARLIGLPVAKTNRAWMNGHEGILSHVPLGRCVRNWNRLSSDVRSNFARTILRPDRLYKAFVFDAWVCNIDRSGKNIITYPRQGKIDFYLIDHELSLLGAIRFEGRPWYSDYWNSIRRYTQGYHPALLPYIESYQQVATYVREIQRIKPTAIRAIIRQCPRHLLSPQDRVTIEHMLLHRQQNLNRIIKRCVSSSNFYGHSMILQV